jgi:glutaminyl-tRNA synthetase
VDNDSSSDKLVFNKTVGLRDSWAKVKPKPQANHNANNNQQKPQQQSQRKAIDVIQKLGKKYTNLPEEKRLKVRAEILELAKDVIYDEVEPLFNTAVKKVGTRIAVALILKVLLENGQAKNDDVNSFIEKALEDKNELLVEEAKTFN